MSGTITASTAASSFWYLDGGSFLSNKSSSKSTPNLFIRGRNGPKASLHVVMDEALVECKKAKERSLYDVLNVKRNASHSEIKSAYKSLVKRYHPDACDTKGDGGIDFIDIHNAYVTLSDPSTRALYDLKLCNGLEQRSGRLYASTGMSSGVYTGQRWETDQCW